MRLNLPVLIFSFLFNLTAWCQVSYDEVFDGSEVRPQYSDYWKVYTKKSDREREAFVVNSLKDFKGDNPVHPLPRILTAGESQLLRAGVDQRGRALRKFLVEYYKDPGHYLLQKTVPENVVISALRRSKELPAIDMTGSHEFDFWYGPDIIRDASGVWRVIEDNTGFIGGMGDLKLARKTLKKNMPEYIPFIKDTRSPAVFYSKLADHYKDLATKKGGIPLLLTYTKARSADNEDARVRKLFAKHGIESYRPKDGNQNPLRHLSIKTDGVYLDTVDSQGKLRSQKVGHIILDYEAHDIDVLDPNNRLRNLQSLGDTIIEDTKIHKRVRAEIQELLYPKRGEPNPEAIEKWLRARGRRVSGRDLFAATGYEGFWESVRKGHLSVTNGWGIEFTNDKGFYPYMENVIRDLLNEEPILRNIETHPAALYDASGKAYLNQEIVDQVEKNPDEWVTKGANGRGGDQIFIGKKISPEQFQEVMKKVKADPEHYGFQKYTPLSEMDGYIVDIRNLANVSSAGVITSNVPWGRLTPKSGNGLVNISAQGRESVLLVQKRDECSKLLSGLSNESSETVK